jgi:hypothetical protein
LTFDDLQHTQGYRKQTVYLSSKLANLWPPATLYSSRQSHDVKAARRLWTASEELTGVRLD